MKKYVGIDISKATFWASFQHDDKPGFHSRNWDYKTEQDVQMFVDHLKTAVFEPHCVMEATGTYHLLLAHRLTEAGVAVSVINPMSFKNFVRMNNLITKTDKQDSITLAKFGESQKPDIFKPLSETILKLNQRRMILNNLQEQRQRVLNQLEALNQYPEPDQFTQRMMQDAVIDLEDRIEKVNQSIKELVKKDYQDQVDLVMTIPGFGQTTSTIFVETINAFVGLENDKSGKAFSKFIGLVPVVTHSGASVRGANCVCRTGAPTLRNKLYLPVCTICTRTKEDTIFKKFYLKLKNNGKSSKEAIIAVMHKLIRIAVAVIRNNQPFDLQRYGKIQTK